MQLHYALFRLNQASIILQKYYFFCISGSNFVVFVYIQRVYNMVAYSLGELTGTILAGTIAGTGLEKMAGYLDIRPTGTEYLVHPYFRDY